MIAHTLKTDSPVFDAMLRGDKDFDVRPDDRGFKIGDMVVLLDHYPDANVFSGRAMTRLIKYILKGGQYGIEPGYVVLGLAPAACEIDAPKGLRG